MLAGLAWLGSAAGAQTLRFSNQTDAAGVTCSQDQGNIAIVAIMSAGGAAGDFNNDGYQDLWVLSGAMFPDRLFINNGDGTFTDEAEAWGVARNHAGVGIAVGDYNNDGWLDVFITSGGEQEEPFDAIAGQHMLYRNNGDGTFTDVADEMGVSTTSLNDFNGWGAAWGDYDLDGDLDLAVAGWMAETEPANVLFRNDGDGFTQVTDAVCLDGNGDPFDFADPHVWGFSPMFCDMDGDLYPELLWVSDFGTSKYFVNNRDGTFTEYTAQAGVGLDGNGMGLAVGDIDNDGDLDFYVTSIFGPPSENIPGDGNKLYINEGGHAYTEIAALAGVDDGGWGWGTDAQDFDHDRDVDLVETNGFFLDGIFSNEQSYLWLNEGPGKDGYPRFREVALEVGLEHFDSGKGLVTFDYDNDGDRDIVIFADGDPMLLSRNDLSGPDTHWLRVFLDTSAWKGLAPNGYGSLVQAEAGGDTMTRPIAGGSRFLSQSELSAHFGLGDATVADSVLVRWANGRMTRLERVDADQTMTIRFCVADMSSREYGVGDGVVDVYDFSFFIDAFLARDMLIADLTGSTDPNDPAYGVPDGSLDIHDFFFFLDRFVEGCG